MRSNVQRTIIFANGELPDLDKARTLIQENDYIICADGGTRHALALNIQPDLVIGDMDSADREQLKALEKNKRFGPSCSLMMKMRRILSSPSTPAGCIETESGLYALRHVADPSTRQLPISPYLTDVGVVELEYSARV